MSTNKTENLGLHSWVREDKFSMDEFNENFNKLDQAAGETQDNIKRIDTTLAEGLKFACGTYDGKGFTNSEAQVIELGFTPKMVYVGDAGGCTNYSNSTIYGGVAIKDKPALNGNMKLVEIVEGGFKVCHYSPYSTSNYYAVSYRYFAIG